MLFVIAQKIHTSKKNKPESAGEEGEKSNKYAFNLYKTFYTAKLHVHPYKKLAVLHGLPDSQVVLLFLGFS